MDQELASLHELVIERDCGNAGDKLQDFKNRFSNLDNVSEMITIAEILSSAEVNLPGFETDWYWILQVPVTAKESDIRTSFLELEALLTPLKSVCRRAESALKLVTQAFSVLSDPEKRKMFDSSVAAALKNIAREQNVIMRKELVSETGVLLKEGQIWAVFDEEKLPRRYARIIGIDDFGLCVNWLKSDPESIDEKRWCEVGLPVSSGIFQVRLDEFRVDEFEMFSHLIPVNSSDSVGNRVKILPMKNEVWAIYRNWEPRKWCSNPRERKSSVLQMVEILNDGHNDGYLLAVELKRVEDRANQLKRCKDTVPFKIPTTHLFRFSHNVPILKSTTVNKDEMFFEVDPRSLPEITVPIVPANISGHDIETKKVEAQTNPFRRFKDADSMFGFSHDAPVSNITIIDKINTPSEVNPKAISESITAVEPKRPKQVWAVYDSPDSLPREYVVVKEVISETEVSVTLLEPHSSIGYEKNLPLVCGKFKESKITCSLNSSLFSHLVTFEKSRIKNSFYMIYPNKGEIWAVYRFWNSWWKQEDFAMSELEIVEILTDWDDETVEVASLEQVPGHLTFFQREVSDKVLTAKTVSRTEMRRFSHRIVGFSVPESKRVGVPEGSWHLEPNALPPRRKSSKLKPFVIGF